MCPCTVESLMRRTVWKQNEATIMAAITAHDSPLNPPNNIIEVQSRNDANTVARRPMNEVIGTTSKVPTKAPVAVMPMASAKLEALRSYRASASNTNEPNAAPKRRRCTTMAEMAPRVGEVVASRTTRRATTPFDGALTARGVPPPRSVGYPRYPHAATRCSAIPTPSARIGENARHSAPRPKPMVPDVF